MQYHPSKARAPVTSRKLSTEPELSSGPSNRSPRLEDSPNFPSQERRTTSHLPLRYSHWIAEKSAGLLGMPSNFSQRGGVSERDRSGVLRAVGPHVGGPTHVRPPDCPRELASLGTKFVPQNHTTP
ncbi:hypothetical protein Pcinc_005832 [Petrolisthes cinctipes]|uniref:Uncharacterized protein n=1 Tax=Petrolisthes cinctipes TaxID=88211 RepID=A0AAE1GCJ9_PETCI|nr:hypothetical protein Pcinc_005832 [Petrolisthes cinctipes]